MIAPILIFLLIIILILIICNIIIKSYTTQIKIKCGGGTYKEDINSQLNELMDDLTVIYQKIENYDTANYNNVNYDTANYDTVNYDTANYNTTYINTKTKTDIIKDIIQEYNNKIDYYKVLSHEKVNNDKYIPGDKIYLDKVKYLLNIGHLPEGHFFLKNGKIIHV